MNKNEFIDSLNQKLKNYPDRNDIISYYYELISDKIDSGENEEEVIASLGSIDDIIKNVESDNQERNEEEFKCSVNEENTVIETYSTYNTDNSETKPNISNDGELHGGRKFWYVMWQIATVIFCVLGVILEVLSCCFIVFISAELAFAIYLITKGYLALAGIFGGIFIFILGFAIVCLHYARFTRKCMFRNRPIWVKKVRDSLGGNK